MLDQIHVRLHVLHYAHPRLAGQAWWVAPQFGAAVVLITLLAIDIMKRAVRAPRDRVPVVVDGAIFVAAYTVTGLLRREPWLVVIVLLCMWAAAIFIHRERIRLVTISIVLALVGPIYESVMVSAGAFRYDVTALVVRVPVWLPALYLNAGVLTASVARLLTEEPRSHAARS